MRWMKGLIPSSQGLAWTVAMQPDDRRFIGERPSSQ